MINHRDAKALFHYDPKTGSLTHRVTRGRWRAGQPAGTIRTRIDATITVRGRQTSLGRFLYFLKTGNWPKGVVDHKNGDPTDFRWRNLRDVSPSQNNANQRARPNKTGYAGVSYDPRVSTNRYKAVIHYKGMKYYLGRFPTAREASRAYLAAKAHIHGEWSRQARRTKAKFPGIVSVRPAPVGKGRPGRQDAKKDPAA